MTTQLAELTDLVRAVLRNPDIELQERTRFDDLPAWDSMHLVGLVVEAECRYGVLFEPDEVDTVATPADMIRLIDGKVRIHPQGRHLARA